MSSLFVLSGQTVTTSTSIGGADFVDVASGGRIAVDSGSALLWTSDTPAEGVLIVNDGEIDQTGTGAFALPAISTGGASPAGLLVLDNSGLISTQPGPSAIDFGSVGTAAREIVTNSGSISAVYGKAIQFGAGDDVLNLVSGYAIVGRVDGGAGVNTLNLSGAAGGFIRGATEFGPGGGDVTFAGFDRFGVVDVQSGAWSLYGGGHYDSLTIAPGASFVVDGANAESHGDPTDLSFSSVLLGGGTLVQTGAAYSALLDGTNFSGNVVIDGGMMAVDGTISTTTPYTAAVSGPGSAGSVVALANAGAISSVSGPAVSLYDLFQGVALENTGSLTGGMAAGARIAVSLSDFDDAFANTGTVVGDVLLGGGDDAFVNAGAVDGAIKLGAGNDFVFFHPGGYANGPIYGGPGADTFAFIPFASYNDQYLEGRYEVADFSLAQGDRLDLAGLGDLSLSQLLAGATQSGPDTIISLAHASIVIDNFQISALAAATGLLNAGGGDLNGDGNSDLIWQTANGWISAWEMRDTSAAGVNLPAAPGWQALDTGDFNADGFSADILLRNVANGMVDIWTDTAGIMSGADVGRVPLDWNIMGTADFDSDGRSDILWRNEQNGYVSIWLMNGTQVQGTWNPGRVGPNWHIVGAADYTGDGRTDILWRDANSGEVDVWSFDSAGRPSGMKIGTIPLNWAVAGSGDFTGDGVAGVLWRDSILGQAVITELNGGQLDTRIIGQPGPQWKVGAVADVNGDGKADIIWRDSNTGQVVAWVMNGFTVDHAAAVANVDAGWQLLNHHFDWI